MKNLTIVACILLDVHAGPISGHLTLTTPIPVQTMCFLGYNSMHKGFKCLDVAAGQVYISRDVVFDESVYPFSKLNPNAGVRL
jgi:hypothetical protein